MANHDELTGISIHVPHTFTYTSEAARVTASGFVTKDIDKFARQESDKTYWVLEDTTPTWTQLGGGGGTLLPFDSVTDPLIDAAVTIAIIDANGGTVITTTTIANNQTLANPTLNTVNKTFVVINNDTSTNSIVIQGDTLLIGDYVKFYWDGTVWIKVSSGSGSTVPGGTNNNIQYNDGGSFGGDANNTWDKVNKKQTILGDIEQKGGQIGNLYTPVLESTTLLGSNPRFSVALENYVFVVDNGSDDFKILDVTDPTSPTVVGTVVIPTSSPRGVDVAGRFAYVADATGQELIIIDHIDKTNPVIISTTVLTGTGSLRGIKISGNVAYLTSNTADFTSVDITNPENPIQLQVLVRTNNSRVTFDIIGSYAYLPLAASVNNFEVIDISDPSNMISLNIITTGVGPFDVKVEGRYAHILATNNYIVVDISDPSNLSIVSTTDLFSDAHALFLANGFSYVIDTLSQKFIVVDARDVTAPVVISTAVSLGTNPVAVSVVGRYAYILDNGSDQLFVINIGGADFQSTTIGSAFIGDLQVRGEMNVAKRIKTESLLAGVGGMLSNGPVAAQGFLLTKKAMGVVEITKESDFKAVGGVIIPPFLFTQYKMLANVTMSSRFVLPARSVMEITAPFQNSAELTYTGTGTLITANDLSDLRIDAVNILCSGSGTLFDITGVTEPSVIVISNAFIAGFANFGSITSFPIVNIVNSVFAENASGLTLTDTNLGINGMQYFNSTDTSSTFFTIAGTATIFVSITQVIATLRPNEIFVNIASGIGSVSSLFIEQITRTLGSASGTFFSSTGIDGTDVRVIVRDVDGVQDSGVSADLILEGNTATTDIPAISALVEINTDMNWVGTEVERLIANIDGSVELINLKPVILKLDSNINLAPTTGSGADLGIRNAVTQPIGRTVTFTNGTNLINETSTPRLVDDLISFRDSAGILPAELRKDIVYYVVSVTVNAFQVSYTKGGVAITFTDDGTPTNIYKVTTLHGSTPINNITSTSPRDLIPQASLPLQTGGKAFTVIQNFSSAIDINVINGYHRFFV